MGLDVYVYRCPDRAAARASEKEYEKISEEVSTRLRKQMFGSTDWKALDKYSDDQRTEFWRILKETTAPDRVRLGIKDDWGSHLTDEKIEIDSAKHPKHYFKIGYFRSSYNDGGFNSYARRLGIPELREIFANESDEYEFVPDWAEARERAIDALSVLRRKDFGFDVMRVEPALFAPIGIADENQALECFRKQHAEWADRKEGSFEAYENRDGYFNVKGLTIHAAIPGITTKLRQQMPCTYLLVKRDEENWYAQALEIVIETCNYVLEQPDREHYYLHWSG